MSNQSSDLANCSLTFKNNLGHRVPLHGKWANIVAWKFGALFLDNIL